jgi:hypothetical protein
MNTEDDPIQEPSSALTRKRVNDWPLTWHINYARRPRRDDRRGSGLAEFSYLGGISADRLAPSMLKKTIECMMIARTSALAISINIFELRAYILWSRFRRA